MWQASTSFYLLINSVLFIQIWNFGKNHRSSVHGHHWIHLKELNIHFMAYGFQTIVMWTFQSANCSTIFNLFGFKKSPASLSYCESVIIFSWFDDLWYKYKMSSWLETLYYWWISLKISKHWISSLHSSLTQLFVYITNLHFLFIKF